MFEKQKNSIVIIVVQILIVALLALAAADYFSSKNDNAQNEQTSNTENESAENSKSAENTANNESSEENQNEETNLNKDLETEENLAEKQEENKEEITAENEEKADENKEETVDLQADKAAVDGKKYLFLPYEYIMYNNKGDITNKSSYSWEEYISPFDYKVSYNISQQQNTYIDVSMERKNNIGKINHRTYINNILDKDLSYTDKMEFYDNSSVILKFEKIKWNGEIVPNSLSVERNQQVGLVRLIEVLDKSFNLFKRYDILNDGTRTERHYINYGIQSLTEYEDYYYENVLITSLYHTEHYTNNKLIYITELKVDNVEEIDENTVKIKMVQENIKDNKRIIDYKSEYILKKYMVEENGKVTLANKAE